MKNIKYFYLKIFIFLVVKFSIYLNRHVFVMVWVQHESSFIYIVFFLFIYFLFFIYLFFQLKIQMNILMICNPPIPYLLYKRIRTVYQGF